MKNFPLVRLQKNFKFYQLGTEITKALWDINFKIKLNKYAVIMSPFRSGKSTLLNILVCLVLISYVNICLNCEE